MTGLRVGMMGGAAVVELVTVLVVVVTAAVVDEAVVALPGSVELVVTSVVREKKHT